MKKHFIIRASNEVKSRTKINAAKNLHEEVYTAMICDNNGAASRGTELDRFYEEAWWFEQVDADDMPTDKRAIIYACSVSYGYDDWIEFMEDYDTREGLTQKQFMDLLDAQDVSAGFPIVYGIKRKNGSFLYKLDIFNELEKEKKMMETGWDS